MGRNIESIDYAKNSLYLSGISIVDGVNKKAALSAFESRKKGIILIYQLLNY